MPLTADLKEKLAALNLPGDFAVRERLTRWMAQTGWSDGNVADSIARADGREYGRHSVCKFRTGCYDANHPAESNSLAIRAALVSLMDSNPTINERIIEGRTYPTESYKKLRKAFRNALDLGWSYCIDGAPGTQKTRLLLALQREIEIEDANKNGTARRVLYVRCRPKMSRSDLLAEVLVAGGVLPGRGKIGPTIRRLRHSFSTRRALLVLDEAQDLSDDALNTIRELLDEPPYFGLLFAGTHDLRARFEMLDNERLRSRQRKFIELSGLTQDEVKEIWESEIHSLSAEKLAKLIEYCTVPDNRRGRKPYISARQLFFAIDVAKRKEASE